MAAANRNPTHYQSIEPGLLGRTMDVALNHMAWLSSTKWAFEKIGADEDDQLAGQVLAVVKSIGRRGRTVSPDELPQIITWCRSTAGAGEEDVVQ